MVRYLRWVVMKASLRGQVSRALDEVREGALWLSREVFQAEGTARAKALRLQRAQSARGTARGLCGWRGEAGRRAAGADARSVVGAGHSYPEDKEGPGSRRELPTTASPAC